MCVSYVFIAGIVVNLGTYLLTYYSEINVDKVIADVLNFMYEIRFSDASKVIKDKTLIR